MSLSDPIADLLTRIRNACLRKHKIVSIPFSKIKENIAKLLLNEGFITSFKVVEQQETKDNSIEIELKYDKNKSPCELVNIKQTLSRPRLRNKYRRFFELILNLGRDTLLIVTSKGLLFLSYFNSISIELSFVSCCSTTLNEVIKPSFKSSLAIFSLILEKGMLTILCFLRQAFLILVNKSAIGSLKDILPTYFFNTWDQPKISIFSKTNPTQTKLPYIASGSATLQTSISIPHCKLRTSLKLCYH